MVYAPNLSAAPNGRPMPFVEVVVVDMPTGTDRLTVWRSVKGRRFKVRGAAGVLAAGGVTVRDFEAPFNVMSSYQVEHFDALGISIGFSSPSTVTLFGLGKNEAYFHDPLDPNSGVKVVLTAGAAADIVRGTAADVAYVPGRSVGITFPGTRSGVEGVVLDCYTATREQGEKFDALFGGYDSDALSVVCVRARPETWLQPTLFAFVGQPHLRPVGRDGEGAQWVLTGDETAPPTPAVITPLLTYQDFTDFFTTYAEFTAYYYDYLTASRDYSIGEA